MILDYDPKYCPFCASRNMTYGEPQVQEQAQSIDLPITCSKCKSQWVEIFTFSNAQIPI